MWAAVSSGQRFSASPPIISAGRSATLRSREISHLAKPIGVGLGILALIGVSGLTLFLHRHEAELEKKAEVALPGPLQPVRHRKRG